MTEPSPRMRPAAVAGRFYPADVETLRSEVEHLLTRPVVAASEAKALIAPHAAYAYSGPVAGTGYAALRDRRGVVERVVLLGPAHFVRLDGVATISADALDTPLGPVLVDDDARRAVLRVPGVTIDDRAHEPEHSLEVHLPFIVRALGAVRVLPLVTGRVRPDGVAAALDAVWGGPETLVVVSTDLSHYHEYAQAAVLDRRTAAAIVARDADAIGRDDACGSTAVRGLLLAARRHGLDVRLLDLRSSGDTAGPRDRVVGYGAFVLEAAGQPRIARSAAPAITATTARQYASHPNGI